MNVISALMQDSLGGLYVGVFAILMMVGVCSAVIGIALVWAAGRIVRCLKASVCVIGK